MKEMKGFLEKHKLGSLLVSNPTNIHYLTGFRPVSAGEREAFALVTEGKTYLITYAMYQEEAREAARKAGVDVVIIRDKNTFKDLLERKGSAPIGFEEEDLRVSEFEKIKKYNIVLQPVKELIENLRLIKTKTELAKIRKAVRITDEVYEQAIKELSANETEISLARKIENKLLEAGADDIAFKPIVASGKNSALPHHPNGKTKIEEGILLIDMGAKVEGYCADLTRTIYLGKPDEKFKQIYNLVKTAHDEAIKVASAGLKASEVDKIAREELGEYEKYFITSTGHGVGLDIHEKPHLSPGSNEILKANMIITIEPGIYIPSWGGVRIEDYCLVKKEGIEVLSQASYI